MNRVLAFARSVLPNDPMQLVFLCGSLMLMICMQLRCAPAPELYGGLPYIAGSSHDSFRYWQVVSIWARLPIVFAGIAGLYACLRPGKPSARRILLLVCVPGVAGLATLSVRFVKLLADPFFSAAIEHSGPHNEMWTFEALWQLGPGFHLSLIGTLLILFFESRLAMGLTSLPLEIGPRTTAGPDDEVSWKRILITAWVSIGCFYQLFSALIAVFVLNAAFAKGVGQERTLWLSSMLVDWSALGALVALTAWAVGKDGRTQCVRAFRAPAVQFGALAMAIPAAIDQVPGFASYGLDRLHAKSSIVATAFRPQLEQYVRLPLVWQFWALPSAALEEIVWRGLLQPKFIKRYGMTRGIFLIGLIWSAFHFSTDFRGATESGIAVQLVIRLTLCIGMSYVFAWLTLQSGSIWPAMVAHGIHNVCVSTIPRLGDILIVPPGIVLGVVYLLIGFALFRYWPPGKAGNEASLGAGGIAPAQAAPEEG